jgi:hypothetical protein
MLVESAQSDGQHYLFLDTDSTPECFQHAAKHAPNAISVYRDAAPTPGSQVQIRWHAGFAGNATSSTE